ncbi:hypothetical protein [Pseudomonas monsensis]|uniref:hypothetical protein n=1 Tax=Pseudomonas monsensis TaxID=2745509 RepID=UPI002AB823A4|nr:hypothetical protein [Pseudomonas monsensis]MDZ3826349.1 hypothetical protein [Pseudomonas monsensis]
MEVYFIQGVILPERADFDLSWSTKGMHLASGNVYSANVSIMYNQVAIWLESENEINADNMKHVVDYLIINQVAAVSYLAGCVYDFQVTRVINRARNIDYVVGVDTSVIFDRRNLESFDHDLGVIRRLQAGIHGTFIHRCLADLVSAMRYREDTSFYCYRAIEALRNHCAEVNGIGNEMKDRGMRWEKFREVTGVSEERIGWVAEFAKNARHGGVAMLSADEYGRLLNETWDIVSVYFKSASSI